MPTSPYVIRYGGVDYSWLPSKSTPSARKPLAELQPIIDCLKKQGVRSVCDFGAGRGRNMPLLATSFDRVLSVEEGTNVDLLSDLASRSKLANCRTESWQGFCESSRPLSDAALLCCVLHTLPDRDLRVMVIRQVLRRLRRESRVVLVSPRNDSRYRESVVANAVAYGEGIVRLYRNPNTFSFYQTLSRGDLVSLMADTGLSLECAIRSKSRLVLISRENKASGR